LIDIKNETRTEYFQRIFKLLDEEGKGYLNETESNLLFDEIHRLICLKFDADVKTEMTNI
jgi:hypothetical protein